MSEEDDAAYLRTQTLLIAWQCINSTKFEDSNLAEKAKWLMSTGLSRSDAAIILGSTDNSLRVTLATDAKKSPK